MSIDKIIQKLEKEKEEKILEIKTKVEKEFEKILNKKKHDLTLWKNERKRKLEEELQREESIILAKKKLKFKEEISLIENEMLLKLKEDILKKFLSLDKEKYNKYWEKILEKEGIENAEIILSDGETILDVDRLCKKYNLIYNRQRYEGKAGFMLKKDNIIIDFTLENIIEDSINKYILEIAKILREG